ncbi:MAG: glucosaminidase domain-containing protein [Thermoleophilia bacterium]|nr:glucosaminidase domain-containing protein [Thermoleophilia bacterium]
MPRHLFAYSAAALPVLASTALGVAAAVTVPAPATPARPGVVAGNGNANDQLSCVAPQDAAGIDAILTRAGSPLAGDGRDIVASATAAGIDPRFVVAVAAHETMLMTYAPAQTINNPFGLGPGMRFTHHRDAVRYAARLLGRHYVGEGRSTIPLIGSKWAPVGAANDPAGLNNHWAGGVSRYYAALGGDPHQPVTLDRQRGTSCAPGATPTSPTPATPPAAPAPGTGTPQIVVWDGRAPSVAGPSAAEGGDPATGAPATISRFAFPLAVPADGQVRYTSGPCTAGQACTTPLESAPMAHVVAATDGTLTPATPAEQQAGVAFWLTRPDGDRVGYGALASYAPGIQGGAVVSTGTPLGRSTGSLSFTWQRNGADVNPRPLLAATRPSA